MADRLAPEDIEAIVSGVASNRQLMAGIVEQLKEALQPAPPTTTTGQEPSSQPARANIFFGRGFDLENFLLNNFLFDN